MRRVGRIRPYKACELSGRRVRCSACRRGWARHQWSCCANHGRYMPVCLDCDLALNELALAFFRAPGRATLLARYRRKLRRER
jgi:hypothetical protein